MRVHKSYLPFPFFSFTIRNVAQTREMTERIIVIQTREEEKEKLRMLDK